MRVQALIICRNAQIYAGASEVDNMAMRRQTMFDFSRYNEHKILDNCYISTLHGSSNSSLIASNPGFDSLRYNGVTTQALAVASLTATLLPAVRTPQAMIR